MHAYALVRSLRMRESIRITGIGGHGGTQARAGETRFGGSIEYAALINQERFIDIANRAVAIESRTNLLFSFEKMALRDAVKSEAGARAFAIGLVPQAQRDAPRRPRIRL